jgi:hypothetical protein
MSCGLSWLIAFAISFSMAASFSVVTRDDALTQRSHAAESREGLRAELKRQVLQLQVLGAQRPVAVVQAELQAQAVPPSIWRDSHACRMLNSDYWQRACRDVVRIRKELANSLAYEKVASRIAELQGELNQKGASSTDVPIAKILGEKAVMWFSVVFAAAIELVAGLGLAFVQMAHRAQWQIRQCELAQRLSAAEPSVLIAPSSASAAGSNSLVPSTTQQLGSEPKAKDLPTSAKGGYHDDPAQSVVQPGLQPKTKTSSSGEPDPCSNPVQPDGKPSLHPTQPSSPGTVMGVSPNPVHPNCPASADPEATQVGENRVRPQRGVTKSRNRARRDSASRAGDEAAVRAFLGQLSRGPGRKTQASVLHREYLRRARVRGWPMLNSTAFGLIITELVAELGFEKRKEGAVTMYYGVGIATKPKYEPVAAAGLHS